jgi:hypothetical protein
MLGVAIILGQVAAAALLRPDADVCTRYPDAAAQIAHIVGQAEPGELEPWDYDYVWILEAHIWTASYGTTQNLGNFQLQLQGPFEPGEKLDPARTTWVQPSMVNARSDLYFRLVRPEEAPPCGPDAVPIRLRKMGRYFENSLQREYRDLPGIYCIDRTLFWAYARPLATAGHRDYGPWHLSTPLFLPRDPEGYVPQYATASGKKERVATVKVAIPGDGGEYSPVVVKRVSGAECPDPAGCYEMTYHGSMYETCTGSNKCVDQGYTVWLDSRGTVLEFRASSLVQTASEYQIADCLGVSDPSTSPGAHRGDGE